MSYLQGYVKKIIDTLVKLLACAKCYSLRVFLFNINIIHHNSRSIIVSIQLYLDLIKLQKNWLLDFLERN